MKGQTATDGAEHCGWELDLLRTIMENSVAHLAYLDPEFNYVRVNTAYAEGIGRPVGKLVGLNHFELFPHADNRPVFEKVRDSGEPAEFLAMPIRVSELPGRGVTYWDWSMVPVKDGHGEVQGLVISSLEVTEQVKERQERERLRVELEQYAEQLEEMVAQRTAALQESQARFRTIFEDSVVGIALLDPEGQILASNLALQDMLGYSEEEMRALSLTDFGHPDDAEASRELYETLTSGQLGYYQVEKRYVRKDGEVRWSELTVSRVRSAKDSEPRRVIAMFEDVTEKRISQQALLKAERLAIIGRLGASLAHEINNPLQSVIGSLGLAEEMLDEKTDVRQYLEIAMEELERAAGIVTQLRDLGSESELPRREPTDLSSLVEKVLLLTRKRCKDRGVKVEWHTATGLPLVPLVPDRIQQVFLNLVLNAVEAMPEGGQLLIRAAPTDLPQGVRIRFADTGIGIEPDRLPHIFEPFHSSRPEGLGLGLHISKTIVEEHGGQIEAQSRVGEGTTVTVGLPT
jgi:PAS domain S-box-containing protein